MRGFAFVLPAYDLDVPATIPTTFVLESPVRVEAGQQVRVEISATGARQYDRSLVAAVAMFDATPDCVFWSANYEGIGGPVDWDFMARMYIH